MSTDMVIGNAAAMIQGAEAVRATFDMFRALRDAGAMPVKMTEGEALLCASMGVAFGWGPIESLQKFHVIQGSVTMKAAVMVGIAKAHRDCLYFYNVETTSTHATYETKRRGSPGAERVTFSMLDAKAAQLMGNHMWKKYPKQMMESRASSMLSRKVYPDALAGIYTADEITGGAHVPADELGARNARPSDDVTDAVFQEEAPQRQVEHKGGQGAPVEPGISWPQFQQGVTSMNLSGALALYFDAKTPNDSEAPPLSSVAKWPAKNRQILVDMIDMVVTGAPIDAMIAAGEACAEKHGNGMDMERDKTRLVDAAIARVGGEAGSRDTQIAAALLLRRCIEKPKTIKLMGVEL